jgi:ribonuclease HI
MWQTPLIYWLKCNIDGVAKRNSCHAFFGWFFRNHETNLIYCFVEPLGIASSFQAGLCGTLRAIEVAHIMNWNNIWLETNSALVVLAFKNINSNVTWNLRNR